MCFSFELSACLLVIEVQNWTWRNFFFNNHWKTFIDQLTNTHNSHNSNSSNNSNHNNNNNNSSFMIRFQMRFRSSYNLAQAKFDEEKLFSPAGIRNPNYWEDSEPCFCEAFFLASAVFYLSVALLKSHPRHCCCQETLPEGRIVSKLEWKGGYLRGSSYVKESNEMLG